MNWLAPHAWLETSMSAASMQATSSMGTVTWSDLADGLAGQTHRTCRRYIVQLTSPPEQVRSDCLPSIVEEKPRHQVTSRRRTDLEIGRITEDDWSSCDSTWDFVFHGAWQAASMVSCMTSSSVGAGAELV